MFFRKLFKKKDDKTIVLSSMSDMFSWLNSMKADIDPIITPVLQAQIQLLQTMQNPVVQSMAVDTLTMSLYKTLQAVKDDETRMRVKDCYAVMLQTLMMFNETVYVYEISHKRDQAEQMLISAGESLSESIGNVGALIFRLKSIPIVKAGNVYKIGKECSNFYKAIRTRESYKNKIAELKKEYCQMLEHLFEMLEKYGSLFGESIMLYGMAHRYHAQLMDEYKKKMCEPLYPKLKKANMGKNVSLISKIKSFGFFHTLGSFFSNTTTSVEKKELDVYDVIKMWGNLDGLIEKSQNKIKSLQSDIEDIKEEISQQSIFAWNQRKKMRVDIMRKQKEIAEEEKQIDVYNDNKRSIEAVYQEASIIFSDIEQYEKKHLQVVNQFAIHVS